MEAWFDFEHAAAKVHVSAFYGSTPPRDRMAMVIDINDPDSGPVVEAIKTLARFYLGVREEEQGKGIVA